MTYLQITFSYLSSHHSAAVLLLCVPIAFLILYRLFLHPLSHTPGPWPARVSSIWLYIICYLGIECRVLENYHRKYKTVVLRIAPNTVSISDGAALHSIYVAGGGFMKTERYENFRVGGVHTIFSSRGTAYRDLRAKAVSPLFAMGRIRAAAQETEIIGKCVARYVECFNREKDGVRGLTSKRTKFDMLDLTHRLMIDVVTGYLFNETYGALNEQQLEPSSVSLETSLTRAFSTGKMTASPFIYAIVEAGRYSLLPSWLFVIKSTISNRFVDEAFHKSFDRVRNFAAGIADDANINKDDTYQSRLLAAGISKSEIIVQCMAVIFAGTDSTAVKLVTIIFHLIQNPGICERLREEFRVSGKDQAMDLQTLPLLCAVVNEGLRLGMANPARFTRIVPPGGLETGGLYIPSGTDVGLAPYVLHHNSQLFPEPFEFRPDRWLDGGKENRTRSERQKKEMERDLIPFGVGSRACLARNLATYILFVATKAIVESDVLEGARTCAKTIELREYFNVEIKNHKLEIEWFA